MIQALYAKLRHATKCFICEHAYVSRTEDHAIIFRGRYGNNLFSKTKYVCTKCQRKVILHGVDNI